MGDRILTDEGDRILTDEPRYPPPCADCAAAGVDRDAVYGALPGPLPLCEEHVSRRGIRYKWFSPERGEMFTNSSVFRYVDEPPPPPLAPNPVLVWEYKCLVCGFRFLTESGVGPTSKAERCVGCEKQGTSPIFAAVRLYYKWPDGRLEDTKTLADPQ